MKHRFIVIVSLIIFFISCSKEENEVNLDYFPLHVGNEWDYLSGFTVRTDANEIIDGIEYYRFVSTRSNFADTVHYRRDSHKIFEKINGRSEFLRFDLKASENETWTFNEWLNSPYNYIATLRDREAIVVAENFEFEESYQFYYDIPELADDEHEIFLAKGVGIVHQIYWGGVPMDPGLKRVLIDNKETIY